MKRLISALILLVFLAVPTIALAAPETTDETADTTPEMTAAVMPEIGSETAVLIDAATGQVLFQKDMDKRMFPASITKVMTGLLALTYGTLSDTITMSHDAVYAVETGSSHISLFVDEQITLEQALYALAVSSANDAANGIAEYVAGTMDDFAVLMTETAAELGATDTHFTNANGLPDDNHYTTAHDMARITAAAIQLPDFCEIFHTCRYDIGPTNLQPEIRYLNGTNKFNNSDIEYDGILMSKTGYTSVAKHTLVTAAERDGVTLIAVVMKSAVSTDKWDDTVALLDYGFEQFTSTTVTSSEILTAAPESMNIPDEPDETIEADSLTTQAMTIQLPAGAALSDVQIVYGEPEASPEGDVEIPVEVIVPPVDETYTPAQTLKTMVTGSLVPIAASPSPSDGVPSPSAPSAPEAPGTGDSTAAGKTLKIVLIVAGSLIAVAGAFIVALAIHWKRYERKKKQRQLETPEIKPAEATAASASQNEENSP